MARTGPTTRTTSPFFHYATVLTAYSLDGTPSTSVAPVTVPLLLPQMPAWDVAEGADGQYELAMSIFGGGWNELVVNGVNGGKVTPSYAYTVEDSTFPRFVRSTGSSVDAQYVAAILSGGELAIIAPQPPEPDGTVTVKILTLVKKAALGVVFGDLSHGLPKSFNLLYQVNRTTGPNNRDGTFAGALWLATFDFSTDRLGTPVALLGDMAFAGFDVAVNAGTYCVLAITGGRRAAAGCVRLKRQSPRSAVPPGRRLEQPRSLDHQPHDRGQASGRLYLRVCGHGECHTGRDLLGHLHGHRVAMMPGVGGRPSSTHTG